MTSFSSVVVNSVSVPKDHAVLRERFTVTVSGITPFSPQQVTTVNCFTLKRFLVKLEAFATLYLSNLCARVPCIQYAAWSSPGLYIKQSTSPSLACSGFL